MTPDPTTRVLVAGIPRSGTTWVGRVLGHAEEAVYVHEPDNHLVRPEAWWAKRELGTHPRLTPGEPAPDYERLFAAAFAGGIGRRPVRYAWARILHRCIPRRDRRALSGPAPTIQLLRSLAEPRPGRGDGGDPGAGAGPRTTVVKSIFCARALEWLADRFEPEVVVVNRHPFAVITSWAELGWSGFLDSDPQAVAQCRDDFGIDPPGPGAPWLDRAAWHFGFLSTILGQAVARHPEWQVLSHEKLCAEPEARFATVCHRVGLVFGPEARGFLLASNRPGRGYSTNRVWSEQAVRGNRLQPAEQERVTEILSRFPTARPARAPSHPPDPRRRSRVAVPARP